MGADGVRQGTQARYSSEKGSAPSTRESMEIRIEIQRLQVKKIIRERLIRVTRLSVFYFLTCGHRRRLMDTICSHTGIIIPPLTSCPRPSAWTNQRKNTDITDFARIGLSRIFFFDIVLPMILGFRLDFAGFGALMVLAASRRFQPPLVLKPILTFPKGRDKLLRSVKDFISQSTSAPSRSPP